MEVISFEGIGGAGKSTIARIIARKFSSENRRVLLYKPISRERLEQALTAFPGKREKVWVCNLPYVPPHVEAFCYLALLIKDNKDIFTPEHQYDLVIFDRYIDTISAHIVARNNLHGRRLSFSRFYSWFKKIYEREIKLPDKTFVLDVELSIAEERTYKRENKRYSEDDRRGFTSIKKFYRFLAEREPKRFYFIDANRRIEQVTQEVLNILQK
jgi:thymidylate kinase